MIHEFFSLVRSDMKLYFQMIFTSDFRTLTVFFYGRGKGNGKKCEPFKDYAEIIYFIRTHSCGRFERFNERKVQRRISSQEN